MMCRRLTAYMAAALGLGLWTAQVWAQQTQSSPAPSLKLPVIEDAEPEVAVSWPDVPVAPQRALCVKWVHKPEDARLLLDEAPVPEGWSGVVAPGQRLQIDGEDARVLLVYTQPEDGYVLHQLLEGPAVVSLSAEGALTVQGLGWAHLFRALSEALSPFRVTYETVDTGFESTEVARVMRGTSPYLAVLDGTVSLGDEHLKVPKGRWAEVTAEPRRARRLPADVRQERVLTGTDAEAALLPAEGGCPARAPVALLAAPLVSQICFEDASVRAQALASARSAAYLDSPSPAAPSAQLGDVYLSAGLFAEAASAYRVALIEGGPSAALLQELGNARWGLGDATGALEAYRDAVEVAPAAAGAWFNRALSAGALGQLEEATRALEEATKLQPELGAAQLYLGKLRLAEGDVAAAADALQAARASGALTRAEDLRLLSSALRRANRPAEAVEIGQARTGADPGAADAWFDLARSLMEAGRHADALRAYERALQLEVDAVKQGD